jgi:hypothetical protein
MARRTVMALLATMMAACAPLAARAAFPAGRCLRPACEESPYSLQWTTTVSPLCFRIGSKACTSGG